MDKQWVDTGLMQDVPGDIDRIPEFDPRTGDHLWVILTIHRWGGPNVETPILDSENLLTVQGPGCYHCELPYDQLLAARRCKGPQ